MKSQARFAEFTHLRVVGIKEEGRRTKITLQIRAPVSVSADDRPLYSDESQATFSVLVQQDLAEGLVLGRQFALKAE